MARPRVIAMILPARGGDAGPTVEALGRQSRPADLVVVAGPGDQPPIDSESGASWLWLLERGVLPEPRALETLLDAAERMSATSAPVLLASRILTPEGTLDPASLPVVEVHTPGRLLSALDHRLAALRLARGGSLLVLGDALGRAGVLSAKSAVERDLEWTARLLGRELGVLVPESIVVRPPGAARPRASRAARIASATRLLAGLEGRERAWFAVHLGEQALASRRAGGRR